MESSIIKLGIVGLDASHAVDFTELLHNREHPYSVAGAAIVAAYPGGSDDFELSRSRVGEFTERMSARYGAAIAGTPEEAAEAAHGVLLLSADGRIRVEQFERIVRFGKPIYINKPFALSSLDAREMAALAAREGVPWMSCSALRYAEAFRQALADARGEGDNAAISGIDVYGPLQFEATQAGWFWYGVHLAEMLYTALGRGCAQVTAFRGGGDEIVVGEWEDGRIGTIRGRLPESGGGYGAWIHGRGGAIAVDALSHPKPMYTGLLQAVLTMCREGAAPIDPEETLEIVAFLEAVNQSRSTGKAVRLQTEAYKG